MKEPGRARCRRTSASAFPGIQPHVMMIAVSGEKDRLRAITLGDVQADRALVEGSRSLEVRDLEVDMADGQSNRGFLSAHAHILR